MVSVWGPGSEGFIARVGDRVGFNLAAQLESPPEPPAREVLAERAAEIGWRLPALFEGTDEAPFFDRVREVTCERWHTDRVVLIGDAAYAVHPISGMGASPALQDARVLAQELATGLPSSPAPALERCEKHHRDNVERVKQQARLKPAVIFLESDGLRRARDAVVKYTPLFELFVRRQAAQV